MTKPGSVTVVLVLHAHLPCVAAPEEGGHTLEERWFFEALGETYLPLLGMMESRRGRGLRTPLTVSLSPSLTAMMADPGLASRFAEHHRRLDALYDRALAHLGADFCAGLKQAQTALQEGFARWSSVTTRLPRRLADALHEGGASRWTSPLDHPFFPAHLHHRWMLDASLRLGLADDAARCGSPAEGLWLPECGWAEGVGSLLEGNGLRATLVDAAAFFGASPRPKASLARPAQTVGGCVVLARDPITARMVWSHDAGYPGAAPYREFHRDARELLPREGFEGFLDARGEPMPTGLRPFAIGRAPYDPTLARAQLTRDAEDFATRCASLGEHLQTEHGLTNAVIVAAYDAELFGHWWSEGVGFLDLALDALERHGVTVKGATELLTEGPFEVTEPAPSSWGEGAFGARWLKGDAGAMTRAVWTHADAVKTALEGLDDPVEEVHLVRKLLRVAASDWPFLLREGGAPHYARRRFETLRAELTSSLTLHRRSPRP